MSLTLGEKLRQAREAKKISISEVAEQTRISSMYLESIENNDYKPLPGGIFNKGFVKSFAKCVGVDEKEALADYAQLVTDQDIEEDPQTRPYRPEVLTDDRTAGSMLPTLIFAGVILALLTAGVFYVVDYYQRQQVVASNTAKPGASPSTSASNTNTAGNTSTSGNVNTTADNTAPPANTNIGTAPLPTEGEINVQLRVTEGEVAVDATIDGKKAIDTVRPDLPRNYSADTSLKLSYYKLLAQNVQITVNGKPITAPTAPPGYKKNGLEFEITKDNLGQILQSGSVTVGAPVPMANTNTNTVAPPANVSTPAAATTPAR